MAYPQTHETVVSLLNGCGKNAAIVDLGCGKGEIVTNLNRKGFNNIKYCDIKDRFDGKVHIIDFNNKLSFKDNSFDVVITTEVVHYLENPQQFFREVKRILRPCGILIISFPNLLNIPNRLSYLFRSKFIDVIAGHFDAFFIWQIPNFFKIEKVTYNRGFLPILRVPFIRNKLFGQCTIVKCGPKK